jgi:hypothetical protein
VKRKKPTYALHPYAAGLLREGERRGLLRAARAALWACGDTGATVVRNWCRREAAKLKK